MAHVRQVGPNLWRCEVKRTFRSRETGLPEQLRWSRYADTKVDADEIGVRAERDLDAGIHPQARYEHAPALVAHGMTVGQWVEVWRVDRGLSAEAQRAERVHLDVHILPAWRDVPIAEVTRLAVQQWVNRMSGAPRSVRLRYGTFTKMIRDAIDEPSVPLMAYPCTRITLPKPEPTGRRALTVAEVAAIADACGIHSMLVWTLAFTGCRISELLSRDVGHLSKLAGIELPPATRRRGQQPAPAPTGRRRGGKTPSAIRQIPLCGSHREALLTYVGTRTSGPLFVGGRAGRPSYGAVWRQIERVCGHLELDEPISPHWFRHTHETWLVEDGIPQVAIDERIGHTTRGVQGIYTHVTPAMRSQVLAALERRWLDAHGRGAVPDRQPAGEG